MEESKKWIEEGRLKNKKNLFKKRKNENGRLERHGSCGRKKTKSHFVKFDTTWIWVTYNSTSNWHKKVLGDRTTLRNVGTKLG